MDFTWRRSEGAQSTYKSSGCSRCLWVRVGHGSAPQSNPLSAPRPPLFLSSIHLLFQWRRRSERNNGLFLPPLSSQQWECILNRGHSEPRGSSYYLAYFLLLWFPLLLLPRLSPPHPLLLPTTSHSYCLRSQSCQTNDLAILNKTLFTIAIFYVPAFESQFLHHHLPTPLIFPSFFEALPI